MKLRRVGSAIKDCLGKGSLREQIVFRNQPAKKSGTHKISELFVFHRRYGTSASAPLLPQGTKRILFGKSHSSLTHYSNWKKTASILSQHIAPPPPGPKESQIRLANSLPLEKHKESFEGLLQKKGYSGNFNFGKLKLGGNNCVYQIKTGDAKLLGKVYYRSPDDQRDRLRHEISFTSYLSTQDLPKSYANEIANDTRYGMACFEWVEGKPCENGEEIPEAHWKQCLNFLSAIQKGKKFGPSKGIANGVGSGFLH